MNPLYVILPAVAFFAAIIGFSVWSEKKRKEALFETARMMGFSFSPREDLSTLEPAARFRLFSRGHQKRLKNVMRRSSGDGNETVFDYSFTTGGGKSQRVHRQTVIWIQSGRLKLPEFEVYPENIFHKIGQALGSRDLNPEHSPEFSKRYRLRGTEEVRVLKLFNPEVASIFERNPGVSAAGYNDHAILYRAERRVKPADLSKWIDTVRILVRQLEHRSQYL
jgi:hypothetical protein